MIRRRAILRSVWRCTVWLAVGFVITVAVSWGLAAWMPHAGWTEQRGSFSGTRPNEMVSIARFRIRGCQRRVWQYLAFPLSMTEDEVLRLVGGQPFTFSMPMNAYGSAAGLVRLSDNCDLLGWPPWGLAPVARDRVEAMAPDAAARFDPEDFVTEEACEHATGWPFLAVWYELDDASGLRGIVVRGGIALPNDLMPGVFSTPVARIRALPYLPIWPGLAINSAFWGAVAFGVVSVVGLARRTLRRRRGQCPACAYPVGASPVCTECGAAVTPRPLTA